MDPKTSRDEVEAAPRGRGPLPLLTFAILALLGLAVFSSKKGRPMKPAPDLLRLAFPPGAAVTEHDATQAQVFEPDWWLDVRPLEPDQVDNGLRAYRAMRAPLPPFLEEILHGADGSTIHRLVQRHGDPAEVVRIEYFISFDGDWISAHAGSRDLDRPLDPAPIDAMVRALRLEPQSRPDREVPPAWRAYQRDRRPGSPIAKFVLSMPPAPVLIGDPQALLLDHGLPTDEDFDRGGRKITPEVIEFYTKDDPISIRVDVLLDDPPPGAVGEPVFAAPLRIVDAIAMTCGFDEAEPPQVAIPSGEYDLNIAVVNRGVEDEGMLTDAERFARDDLERYEFRLTPRTSEP
ncbi:hypothetical protein [Paludisphaera soli]|uniref:hypothetical protein n=1 Tax=Paludisphaera soli TaxID=2712865 RepID=UPI0013EDDD20|nr:hypothetical protein [Paludisphaera soli]